MSVITKDLGIASAYGYAKSKGYTGTEEEFAELMASYADVAQQAEAAAQDAEDAKDAAVSAKNDAVTAKTAAQAAQSAAETASGTATTKASEAAQSAQSAAGSASAAQTSATAASGSASTAQTAAQTATNKASEASSSASAASTAKTGAETARTGAQTAQANAEAAASSVSASAAQIEQNTEDIAGLKNDFTKFPNGNYPEMGAGYANQLVSGLKKEDQTPYNFRKVPYDATLGEVEKIVGVDVVLNQHFKTSAYTETNNGITYTCASDGTITLNGTATANSFSNIGQTIKTFLDHKIYLRGCPSGGGASKYNLRDGYTTGDMYKDIGNGAIIVGKANFIVQIQVTNGITCNDVVFKPQFFDLTQTFGNQIADYVYGLETATAGAGVAWLKKHFPAQFDSGYQAYDAGTLKSIEGLSGKKTVGFNQWDEVVEYGYYNIQTGDTGSVTTTEIRSKNFIPVLPNTTYYYKSNINVGDVLFYDANKNYISGILSVGGHTFLTPNGCWFARINLGNAYGNVYNHDICINLSDPTKNGTYEPYEAHSYALDSDVVLRGIPKLDSNNQLYYDGDEYLPDGTVNRRYGIVDLGTLTWNKQTETDKVDRYYTSDISTGVLKTSEPSMIDLVCTRFIASFDPVYGRTLDNAMCVLSSNGALYISASGYADASAFKTAMSGVYLVYAKQTPTTETADPYTTPQIISPDGTEEYIYEGGAFELPVGHSSDYPIDVSGQLDDILDTPSANGTYVLKATVTDGAVTYSWVADA